MSTATASRQQIYRRVEAFRASLSRVFCWTPYLLIALMLGLLNPVICALHCYLHSQGHAAQTQHVANDHHGQAGRTQHLAHDHHGQHAPSEETLQGHSACGAGELTQADSLTPRALYELVSTAPGLGVAALFLIALMRLPRFRPGSAPPLRPLTPSAQALAFL